MTLDKAISTENSRNKLNQKREPRANAGSYTQHLAPTIKREALTRTLAQKLLQTYLFDNHNIRSTTKSQDTKGRLRKLALFFTL